MLFDVPLRPQSRSRSFELSSCPCICLPPQRSIEIMDSPQVQLSGSKDTGSNAVSNTNTDEVEMGAQAQAEAEPTMEDETLPDAQPAPEPPTPAKKSAGFKFLE